MHVFTDKYLLDPSNKHYLLNNMMGPNAMRISEEMASYLDINEQMRILDLSCGRGLSTLFLIRKYGVKVFAADLYVDPTENYKRFMELGLEDNAIPICLDATKGLPFACEYFDILFSVNSYQYYGRTKEVLPSLIPFVKKCGYIAVAVPGWKDHVTNGTPDEMMQFAPNGEDARIHTLKWWEELWGNTVGIELVVSREMSCCTQAWEEWQASPNPNPCTSSDKRILEVEKGQYFSIIQLIAKVL